MYSKSVVVAWTTCNSIYRIAIQQKLLVEFFFIACVAIGHCN